MTKTNKVQLHLWLNETEAKRLRVIAAHHEATRSGAVRMLIKREIERITALKRSEIIGGHKM